MKVQQNYGAHSAQVKMRLLLDGLTLRITHMGPDFVLVESPTDFPPGDASLFLKVDDSESQWKVRLPEGISRTSNRVALALSE